MEVAAGGEPVDPHDGRPPSTQPESRAMDIREILRQDHEEVLQVAAQIEQTDDTTQAKKLFEQLREAVVKHARGEERIVYPALEDSGDEEAGEMAREAAVEHELVDLLFERMMKMRTASDNWKARASVVKELLEHHIEEEQNEVFQMLGELFEAEELEEMGERFESYKGRYKMPGAKKSSGGSKSKSKSGNAGSGAKH
jgi:hemerythrin superfamily protein